MASKNNVSRFVAVVFVLIAVTFILSSSFFSTPSVGLVTGGSQAGRMVIGPPGDEENSFIANYKLEGPTCPGGQSATCWADIDLRKQIHKDYSPPKLASSIPNWGVGPTDEQLGEMTGFAQKMEESCDKKGEDLFGACITLLNELADECAKILHCTGTTNVPPEGTSDVDGMGCSLTNLQDSGIPGSDPWSAGICIVTFDAQGHPISSCGSWAPPETPILGYTITCRSVCK
ncbi:MAG: hypothetical protein AABX02_05515, partial [archaeon]